MIQFKHIKKIYNPRKSNAFEALHDVSEEIKEGEMVALIGTSGAGKTTLLRIAACIEKYQEGEYILDGMLVKNLSEKQRAAIRNEKIGYVMQDFGLIEDFSVLENVMLPLHFSGKKVTKKKEKALRVLRQVGMEEIAGKPCKQLSGGQKQRVAIARAIVHEPKVILADEPTGSLDSKNTMEIMKLFQDLNKTGMTMMIVTHDPGIAQQCQRMIEISDGRIVCDSTNS
jgi:putative ABC transport system ATP-binding protein